MRLIIITGCTSGLGLALHTLLAVPSTEWHCLFIGRNLKRLTQHADHSYLDVDLAKPYDWEQLLPYLEKASGDISLIANAGTIAPIAPITQLTRSPIATSVEVNLIAPMAITAVITNWAQEHGRNVKIINISSGAANRPIRGWSLYCTTKCAYKMYLDVLQSEVSGIDIEHFDPGVMDTDMQRVIRDAPASDMPDVAMFKEFKEDNKLRSAASVAETIISKLQVTL